MKLLAVVMGLGMLSGVSSAQGAGCNMQDYKAADGLRAAANSGGVTLTWQGEGQQELRAQFALKRWPAGGGGVGGAQGWRCVGGAGEGSDAGVPGDDRTSGGCRRRSWTF